LLAFGVAGGAGEIGDSDGEIGPLAGEIGDSVGEIGPLAGEIGDLRLERGDASGAGSEGGREGVVDGRAVGGFHLGDSLIALERVHLRSSSRDASRQSIGCARRSQ